MVLARAVDEGLPGAAPRVVTCVATASVLTEAIDEVRGLAVGIEPSRHEIARTHPAAVGPLAERDASAGSPRCRGYEFHSLERLLDALRRQGPSVGERVQQHRGEIAIDDRHAVLRTSPVARRVLVEELLSDEVAFVVLVEAGPAHDGVPDDRIDPRVLERGPHEARR